MFLYDAEQDSVPVLVDSTRDHGKLWALILIIPGLILDFVRNFIRNASGFHPGNVIIASVK